MFKYQARKGNLTAGELKSFFCHNDESPFKLNDKHHLLYKPIELEEPFISFFLQNGTEVKDDYLFSKDIKLKAKLSIGAYFYPFQLDMDGHKSVIYVFMIKNTKISEIAKLFQNKLQLSPIRFKYAKSFSKPETMTSNASINSYKVSKFINIILPDYKTFGFIIEPNKVPLFYLNLSYKTPIKVIQGRVADEINKRFKIETHLKPQNIQLFLKKGQPLTSLSSQLKLLKEQDKTILVVIKDAVLPSNPSYLFLFPESSVPKLYELDKNVTVENFLNDHISKSKEASLFCKGEKLKRNAKFSELGITMANLIIVKLKGSKTIITIKLPRETFQIKFKNFYQIRDLKEKLKEKIGSTPFDLFYKGQKLEEEKTCRDYGIDGVAEITAHLLKTMTSSGSLLLYNDSSLSVFDTPVEGNPVFFVAKDRRPLSHTFEKKATVAEAKEFIMASWMVKKIDFLLNGRFISEKMKLSKLPISKKIPIAVIIKDQYDEVLEIKEPLSFTNYIKEIKIDLICENNGQMVTFKVKDNPTIGDVLNSIKNRLGIDEDQIDIVYHDKVYSDKKMLLSQIEKNIKSLHGDSESDDDSDYIDSLEQSLSDSDDSDNSNDSDISEEESGSNDYGKNRKLKVSFKNANKESDDDKENDDDDDDNGNDDNGNDDDSDDEDQVEKKKRKSKEDKSKHSHDRRNSKGEDIKKEKSKFKDEKEENESKKGKNKDKNKDDTDAKNYRSKDKDDNESKKSKNKLKDKDEKKKDEGKTKEKNKESKNKNDNETNDKNNSQDSNSDDLSRDGDCFYFRLTLESTSTEQDYINLYSKFSNRHLRRVSKLKDPQIDDVSILRDSIMAGNFV